MIPDAAIYFGHVMHCRLRPFHHKFVYRVFSILLDIDQMDASIANCRLFSHNSFNLFSLMDKDHGDEDGSPLRNWVEEQLQNNNIIAPPARILMLCFPRLLGYVFNPLTVYYCLDQDQRPFAIIYEVRNTFGGKHPYVAAIDQDHPGELITHTQQKQFYVSPFIEMDMQYQFRLLLPDENLSVMIRETAPEGELLIATLTGARRIFSDLVLLKAFFAYPLMTLKVIASIHFEAFRLWRKGAVHVPRLG